MNFWNQNTSYDEKNAEWPPMMGTSQPHWKFFHRYADLIRRISYMNDGGRHVADGLLYRPIASVVAFSDPAFDSTPGHWKGRGRGGYAEYGNEQYGRIAIRPYLAWSGDFSWQAEMDYHGLMNLLVQKQKDFDILDDYYLGKAVLGHGSIQVGPERFGVIVLPPMKVIAYEALDRIRRFYEQGGTVVAYGSLPSGSTGQGGTIRGLPPPSGRSSQLDRTPRRTAPAPISGAAARSLSLMTSSVWLRSLAASAAPIFKSSKAPPSACITCIA